MKSEQAAVDLLKRLGYTVYKLNTPDIDTLKIGDQSCPNCGERVIYGTPGWRRQGYQYGTHTVYFKCHHGRRGEILPSIAPTAKGCGHEWYITCNRWEY